MPLGFLRAAVERLELGKELRDDPQLEREGEADGRRRREQQFFDFTPDAFGRQVVERNLAASDGIRLPPRLGEALKSHRWDRTPNATP